MKKYCFVLAVAVLLPMMASAKSLESSCSIFQDDWFPEIIYSRESCTIDNFESIPVNTNGITFEAFIAVNITEGDQTPSYIDGMISVDYSGGDTKLGERIVDSGGGVREFKEVNLGDYGTLLSDIYGFGEYDENDNLIREMEKITYLFRVRLGECYTTFETAFDQPKGSGSSGSIYNISENKVKGILAKMSTIGICKASSVISSPESIGDPVIINEPLPLESPREPLTAIVTELEGTADVQLGDGTWVVVEIGMVIPNDATIYTGYGGVATLLFSDYLIVVVSSLSEMNIYEFETDALQYRTELHLGTGELNFKILEGDFRADMRVSTPNASASIVGTEFIMSYNKDTEETIFQLLEGKVELTSSLTEETKTISAENGSVEVKINKEGVMEEKSMEIEKDFNYILIIAGIAIVFILSLGFLLFKKKE